MFLSNLLFIFFSQLFGLLFDLVRSVAGFGP